MSEEPPTSGADGHHRGDDEPAGILARALLVATPFALAVLVWWILRVLG